MDDLIDKRILERQIKRGKMDASEYRHVLDRLPDRSDLAQRFELEPEPRPAPIAAAVPRVAPAPVAEPVQPAPLRVEPDAPSHVPAGDVPSSTESL